MKKSTIYILSAIMFIVFFTLLSFQFIYIKTIIKDRGDHFDEVVKRSLYNVSKDLELEQTYKYLLEDIDRKKNLYKEFQTMFNKNSSNNIFSKSNNGILLYENKLGKTISGIYSQQQKDFILRYTKEQDLVLNVVSKILNDAGQKSLQERINFKDVEKYISIELKNNALYVPFSYKVIDYKNKIIYKSFGFNDKNNNGIYSQNIFTNDPPSKTNQIMVYFPTKKEFIYKETKSFYPSFVFTIILLFTFSYTIFIIFRQKRLSLMKTDFINNMTHELKTPVSTISLAAQMLRDESTLKSQNLSKKAIGIINEETKRLSFQVEKVLQMSLFDQQKSPLKLKEVDANELIVNVANTHLIKVEKFGGSLEIELEADNTRIYVDEMHFTNILFNLLENALKYKKENEPPKLIIRTKNEKNRIIISVEDNGIGIKKEFQKKIFERFFRVQKGDIHDVKGFGLGLAYVKKIILDLKGTIKAESEFGIGTKFIINLPTIK